MPLSVHSIHSSYEGIIHSFLFFFPSSCLCLVLGGGSFGSNYEYIVRMQVPKTKEKMENCNDLFFFFSLDFYFFNAECSAGGGVFFFYLIFFELKLLCTPIAFI